MNWNACTKGDFASDEVKEKAQSEIKLLAGLTGHPGHPGIVCYYESWIECPPQVWLKQFDSVIPPGDNNKTTDVEMDAGVVTYEQEQKRCEWLNPGQLLYVRMELCQQTLKAWLSANTGHDQKQVQDIFRQTVGAVHYVHEHGLMHRDIKPSNLFVQEKGEKVTVKLGDFSLVTSTTSDHQTMRVGTELYMSPEQATLAVKKDHVAHNLLKGMLEREPSHRLAAEDILSHPYWWDGTRRYAFLAVIGGLDEIENSHDYEKEPRQKSSKAALVHAIEDTKPRVLPPPPDGATTAGKRLYWDGDWESLSIVDSLRKKHHESKKCKHSTEKTGHTQSLCKLLWQIRNSKVHDDQSEAFKAELGDCPFDYFNCNFPQLLMEVYNVIKSRDDWTQKTNLKEFFAAPAKTEETGAVAATPAATTATTTAATAATTTAATTAATTTAAATATAAAT
ncbi:hypothetical protein LSAT2_014345 [Lamellibrachia satsuma]|nr:hypothetical protein LSAT2_014345 [Lamellibrachia satsuma]